MAGAGYKLFNTGDVLLASEVNTYLMQQTVMVFADSAARTTALSGVVAEGMLSYLKDTDAVEVYNGTSWVASDDPNAIQNTIVDAKGDLIAASADNVPARLAVGNDGETLLADSAATTGLRWQPTFAAGKNKIINGDFAINQRAFTTTTTDSVYTFDRFLTLAATGGATFTAQTFTAGAAPVAGYEAKNFIDIATTAQSGAGVGTAIRQRVEDVRTLANQTATVSFWAKANSGTPNVSVELLQNFGTGGSPSASVTGIGSTKIAITTSWARYSVTVAIPSISGKTLGTDNNSRLEVLLWTSAGTDFNARTTSLGIQTATISFWGLQVEAGSVATAFNTATGTLQGELAACQRYYQRWQSNATNLYANCGGGFTTTTSAGKVFVPYFVPMRVTPTSIEYANLRFYDSSAANAVTSLTIDTDMTSGFQGVLNEGNTAATLTANRPAFLQANNSASGYLALSAEL